MIEVKEYLTKFEALLPVGKSISFVEAERRAGEFLAAMATIANWRHIFSDDKIKLLSLQTATYAEQMSLGTAKTMTENKVTAEASTAYIKAREELESIENDISYLRAYNDIFMAAHVFYRQMAKGENS